MAPNFTYAIVGGGPAGLTAAHELARAGHSVLVLEASDQLGGCHAVMRNADGLFAEHSPRVYSQAYVNTRAQLRRQGMDFDALFVPYKFSLTTIGVGGVAGHLSLRELFWLATAFVGAQGGSVAQFMARHDFSDGARDYIDRLCRLTDGAGADRYRLSQFLQLVNQQWLYSLCEPRRPNDQALFPQWQRALEKEGVHMQLNTAVHRIELKSASGARDGFQVLTNKGTWQAANVVCAIPPRSLWALLHQSHLQHAFPGLSQAWVGQTDYETYVPVALHFHAPLPPAVTTVYGFPASDWGIAFIVMSQYFEPAGRPGIISATITRPHAVSRHTGTSANQSTEAQVVQEVYRQLADFLPLPPMTAGFVTPGVQRQAGTWHNPHTAYIAAAGTGPLASHGTVPGLYTVGSHNGQSWYDFTSMESAVCNALAFCNTQPRVQLPILAAWTLKQLVLLLALLVLLLMITFTRARIQA